ncbi:hypothetical protein ACWGH8_08915 [Nonomuraea muscovyensis]|uniref:Uncharacterized protein n=1 Tax=Nonomuraea muscovyensis TaxID=1124761 RepID=A0A7X0BZQ2_9ACTN|nr:hypothetical protein [Nonomuraea muscovyensis]MBB6345563.1 hypothetical protein [Nonomuraea muscovyensis]
MRMQTYDTESVRPDLPVPLSPLDGVPEVVRRRLLGLGGPGFARAHRVGLAWAALTACLALLGLLVPPPWRAPVLGCAALLGLYVLVRAVALQVFEREQRDFEPRWLAAQSEVLRGHAFEVVRFRLVAADDEAGARRTYDLTRPSDVRAVLRRQERERWSRAGVEFVYRGAGGEGLGEVVRELSEVVFLPGRAGRGGPWIRFPQARYLRRPGERPAEWSYWTLSGPVEVGVSEPSSGGTAGSAATFGSGSAR